MDIILALDRSGSMSGQPVADAVAAARAFISQVDLNVHQIGLVLFHGEASLRELTNDRNALDQTLQGISGEDGTAIHEALRVARAELGGSRGRPTAAKVIILLSDGGSDPSAASSEADAAKRSGVCIITIGLISQAFNPTLLSALASSPADVYMTSDSTALVHIYESLAREISNPVATDISIEEPYDAQAFALVPDSLAPAGTAGEGQLVWSLSALGEEPREFHYAVIAQRLGLYDISPLAGVVNLRDCQNMPLSWASPIGPRVLVISPLCLFPLLLLPLLLLAGVFWWWRRGKEEPGLPAEPPLEPAPPPVYQEAALSWEWARSLRPIPVPSPVEYPSLPPTLIIGLGETGRWILTYVKKGLLEHYGEAAAREVHLLAIDVGLPGHEQRPTIQVGDLSLSDQEILVLQPDLEGVERVLRERPEQYPFLRWWTPEGAEESRGLGRIAIFYDLLHGTAQSRLWQCLKNALPRNTPRVLVVSSLCDEVGSGAYLDIAHLVRRCGRDVGVTRVDAFLTLQGAIEATDTMLTYRYRERAYAALRELARFAFRRPVPFVYTPYAKDPELVSQSPTTVVDSWYLFDGHGKGVDLRGVKPALGVFPAIADSLLTILEPHVHQDWAQYTAMLREPTGQVQRDKGECLISGLGSFVYELPIEDLRRAAEYRLLLHLLYGEGESSLGLLKTRVVAGGLELDASADTEDVPDLAQAVRRFLRDARLPNHYTLFDLVADTLDQGSWDDRQVARYMPLDSKLPVLAKMFRSKLQAHLQNILNGRSEDAVRARSGKLAYALRFLGTLRDSLQEAEEKARWLGPAASLATPDLRHFLQQCRGTVQEALTELEGWRDVLIGRPTGASRPVQQVDQRTKTLYEQLHAGWQQQRQVLQQLRQIRARDCLLDDDLEGPYYRAHLVPGADGTVPRRFLERVGWLCEVHEERWDVSLTICPPEYAGEKPVVLRRGEVWRSLEELLRLARTFSHGIALEDVVSRIRTNTNLVDQLIAQSSPLLDYQEVEASNVHPVWVRRYLVNGESTEASDLLARVKQSIDARLKGETIVIRTPNSHRLAMVSSVDLLALRTLAAFAEAAEYYVRDEQLHVFPAERTAVRYEKLPAGKGHEFHPLFVTLLENEDLAELFAACWIYGFVQPEATAQGPQFRLRLTEQNIDLLLPGPNLAGALESFAVTLPMQDDPAHRDTHPLGRRLLPDTLDRIRSGLAEKRREPMARRRQQWQKARQEIDRLRHSQDQLQQDLGVFLQACLDEEK